jgi:hypothetical protein
MLQQAHSKGIYKLVDHVAQNSSHSIKSFIGLTDVGKAHVVQENPLNNENGNLRTRKQGQRPSINITVVV